MSFTGALGWQHHELRVGWGGVGSSTTLTEALQPSKSQVMTKVRGYFQSTLTAVCLAAQGQGKMGI